MLPPDQEHDSIFSSARQFATTHWTVVLSAGGSDADGAQKALAELCQTYWYPLYAYIRRQGHSPPDAEDLTQEFFAKLLEKNFLASVKQEKGKFRSFLLMTLKRFLANQWDRANAQKRGGRQTIISIDQDSAESRYNMELAHHITADLIFDQRWAMTLLDQVLARLSEEYGASGRARLFEYLRGSLMKDKSAVPYSEIAAHMKMSEGAVKMAVQRLRIRYRELLRDEIAKTVSSPDEIEEEIRHLFATFSG